MSEEILKALMQLFAIIAKQDGGIIENHEKYVHDFLASQLSFERVQEYLTVYHSYLEESKPDTETGEPKRTSMKDSVRTLAICKKINKTLAQKQKYIVLIRLLEFFQSDVHKSTNRMQIVDTVADVFKVKKEEYVQLCDFIFSNRGNISENEIVISDVNKESRYKCLYFHGYNEFEGVVRFHCIREISLIILKAHDDHELHLNGVVMTSDKVYLFPTGSTLRLPKGSVYYSNIHSKFYHEEIAEKISFSAHIVEHKFSNGTKALHELKLREESGSLVGIMGASGSGKTTLLTILSGQEKPYNGEVYINETEIFSSRENVSGMIGYVPQDDLLIEDLTVYQNLYYNAKLCFKDISEAELNIKVNRVLISLGLDAISHIKVGSPLNKKISGGQRKRLNIALELIREPSILFLDEPTSGLSSRDSENVMDLLKELTNKGKLVFVVIHQPSSDIYKMFDKMLILDTGGFPTYYGNPIEAIMYFKRVSNQINSEIGECHTCGSVNPEIIFNLIDLKEIDEYGNYTDNRKISGSKFYEFYREKFLGLISSERIKDKISNTFKLPTKFIQSKVFLTRDLLAKYSNKQYLLINLLEIPTLAFFLSLIIRFIDKSKEQDYTYHYNYNIPAYFFMSIIVALLVGLTVSAEEIYKDQKILKREKILNLSRFSYLVSKVVLLFSLSIIQTILFVTIGVFVLEIRSNYLEFSLMLFSVFCFANLFGLILSSTFNSPVTIYIIIPLIIIPQMILGGAMFSFSKLSDLFGGGYKVPPVSNFMVSRWAYEGIAVNMFINNKYEKDVFPFDQNESILNYKLVYFIPKVEELINDSKADKLDIVRKELNEDNEFLKTLDFKEELPELSDKNNVLDYLSKVKEFYNSKFILINGMKENFRDKLIEKVGGQNSYEVIKAKYTNDRLREIVTESFEKQKIVVADDGIKQVIDPIYKPVSDKNKLFSLNPHFYASHKYMFGKLIPTYYFNLIIIWVINILTFLFLYFDLFKWVLSKFEVKVNVSK